MGCTADICRSAGVKELGARPVIAGQGLVAWGVCIGLRLSCYSLGAKD